MSGVDGSILSQIGFALSSIIACVLVGFALSVQAFGEEQQSEGGVVPRCPDCNIVFVAFDTLRADYHDLVDREGSLMPTVDRLAERGVTFTQAVAASSWTLPSTMSWFTGVSPSRHGMTNKYPPDASREEEELVWNLKTRSPELVTLAEVLRHHGYRTGGFTGGAGVHHQFGFHAGFETYFDDIHFGGFRETVPRALEWVSEHRDEQLFVFLHGYDCHGQHEPAGGLEYRFTPHTYRGPYTGSKAEQRLLRQEGLEKSQLFLRDEDVAFWRGVYAEKVERADHEFSRFLEAYERLGLMEKSIFVISSDHGEELMEHGRLDHGPTLYEEVVRVPLIIVPPGLTEPRRIHRQVRSVDLFPTVLALVSISPSEKVRAQLEGSNVLDPDARPGDALIETTYRYYTSKTAVRIADGNPWKFVITLGTGTRELFNLARDPQERLNLHSSQREVSRELEERLMRWFEPLPQASQHEGTR